MLILIRADLFVTQRDRHKHTHGLTRVTRGEIQASMQPVPTNTLPSESSDVQITETWRERDRWAASWWSESGTGGRGSQVGAAQHDCWSLRRPAVGHSHAFSILCNQAACWLECSRTQRNTAADRCPWQRCPRGPQGAFFLSQWCDKRLKQQPWFVHGWCCCTRKGGESCWLFYVTAKSC